MTDQLQLAVNHALNDMRAARMRMGLLNPGMGLDAKRSAAWCEYGFKENLEFQDFYNLYRRGGIAHGAVKKLVENCWKTQPEVIEGGADNRSDKSTQWEVSLKPLIAGGRIWRAFAEADRRRLVGRYSGLILHLRDSKEWDQPATSENKQLVKITAAWAGSLRPIEYETDPASERYGEPKMWRYTEVDNNGAGQERDIHSDRVYILGDYTGDAIGFLEPAYNAFASLEKVEGGSGESFLKNAARQLAVNFDKEVNLRDIARMYGVDIDKLQERFNDAAREVNRGNDMMLILQGAQATPLVSSVPDPTPTYNVNLQTIAAALDIPSKILVGMQTGERASSEDQKYFNARCQSRRGDLTFEINDLFQHLMRIGVVKIKAEFTAIWDDLTEPTAGDKLANAKVMAEINEVSLASGGEVFSPEEIREAAGFDPDDAPDPLPDEDDEDGKEGEGANPAQQAD